MLGKFFSWFFAPLFGETSLKESDEEKGFVLGRSLREEVVADRDVEAHKIALHCPSCDTHFEHEVSLAEAKNADVNEPILLEAYCPSCGKEFRGTIQRTTSCFYCEKCQEGFSTREGVEAHEKECFKLPS